MEASKQVVLITGASRGIGRAASRLGSSGEYANYAASNGAIDSFTTGVSMEVGVEGNCVNAVRPGFIETGRHASGGER